MQVSALNTIIAAQQARGATSARPPVNAAGVKTPPGTQEFAPLAFAAPTTEAAAAADAPPRPAFSANAPLGSQVDIRV
ncbi:MAG TPA: hypothetical protein VMD53_03800 [Rhizomicrobium sp.]|nr:hypothetical protein [Rhizomicrobium sp.]